jgi:hypothetical protein
MKYVLRSPRSSLSLLLLLAALATCFAMAAPAARAANPLVSFGPVTVADGTARLSGNVGAIPSLVAGLMLNGNPVGIGTDGRFTANVDLHGQTAMAVSYQGPSRPGTARYLSVRSPRKASAEGLL